MQVLHAIIAYSFFYQFAIADHTFYASICEVGKGNNGNIELKVKIFTDDLERALSYELGSQNISDESAVEEYVKLRLAFWINGEVTPLDWDRMEQDDEVTWCYMTIDSPRSIESLKVRNELLIRSISQQVNIVRVRLNGERHFFNLDRQIRFEAIKY